MLYYDPKDKDATEWFEIDWVNELVPARVSSYRYSQGETIRPAQSTGFFYEVDNEGGIASRFEPNRWPTIEGETIRDGSLVWRAVHPIRATTAQILTYDFAVPATMAELNRDRGETITRVQLSGGVEGTSEQVVGRITVSLPVGNIYEKTMVIPIAEQ